MQIYTLEDESSEVIQCPLIFVEFPNGNFFCFYKIGNNVQYERYKSKDYFSTYFEEAVLCQYNVRERHRVISPPMITSSSGVMNMILFEKNYPIDKEDIENFRDPSQPNILTKLRQYFSKTNKNIDTELIGNYNDSNLVFIEIFAEILNTFPEDDFFIEEEIMKACFRVHNVVEKTPTDFDNDAASDT